MANVRDFYMRSESDPRFVPDQIEVYDELEACLTQVKMTLFTNKGEVLGEPEFGLSIEKYLFEFDVDPFELTKEAQIEIDTYIPEAKKRKIKVTPAEFEDEKNRKTFVLGIDIEERKNAFFFMFD